MEEKAEAMQKQGLQRNTNFRVLPREDPSMGDETSEYKKQKPSMLPLHKKTSSRLRPSGTNNVAGVSSGSRAVLILLRYRHASQRQNGSKLRYVSDKQKKITHTQIDLEQCNRNVTLHGLLDRIVLPM